MAYLHCHNCNWQQDDFWDENYNPIIFLERNYKSELLEGDLEGTLQFEYFTKQAVFLNRISRRDWIARELERAAKKVREMEYRTPAEFEKVNPRRICPNCGKQALDID